MDYAYCDMYYRFDRIFPLVLEQIQPVCVAEQKFLNSFFHFERTESVPDKGKSEDDLFLDDEVDGFSKAEKLRELSEDKAISGDVGSQNLLNQLFSALLPEIEEFIDFGERQDS